jgi:hypothetical protein
MVGVIGNPSRVQLNSSQTSHLAKPFQLSHQSIATDVASLLADSRLGKATADITFVVGEDAHTFKAHKCLLAARSQYFRSMLTNGMADSANNVYTLPSWDPRCFSSVLHWIYTDSLELSESSYDGQAPISATLTWRLWEVCV